MADKAIFIGYDPPNNEIFDANNNLVNEDKLPSIYLTNNTLYNLKLSTRGNSDTYTDYEGIDALASFEGLIDNDYDNPVFTDTTATGWTLVSGEYQYDTAVTEPEEVYEDSVELTSGTVGSLALGEWGYSDGKITVRLTDDSAPSTHADAFIQYVATYTPLFALVQSTAFNLTGTWYDTTTSSFRDPVIADGELTFKIDANTADFNTRIGTLKEDSTTRLQIHIRASGSTDIVQVIEFIFVCKNIFKSNPLSPSLAGINIYTKAECDSLFIKQTLSSTYSEQATVLGTERAFIRDGSTSKQTTIDKIGTYFATSLAGTFLIKLWTGLTGKTTPVDADLLVINDSAASYAPKKLTWANLKATLVTAFNSIYEDSSNKVTSISGASTDVEYPSAKLLYDTVAGSGDMVLADVQSVTGLKTYDTTKLAVKGSSTGIAILANANAGATDYTLTLPSKTGTIATTDDVYSQSLYIEANIPNNNSELALHFELQIYSDATYDTSVETFNSSSSQANIQLFDGTDWVAMPAGGAVKAYYNNHIRFALQTAVAGVNYYTRIRTLYNSTGSTWVALSDYYASTYPNYSMIIPELSAVAISKLTGGSNTSASAYHKHSSVEFDEGAESGAVSLDFSRGDYQQIATVAATPITSLTMTNSGEGDWLVIEIDNANATQVTINSTLIIDTTDTGTYLVSIGNVGGVITFANSKTAVV